MLVLEVGKPHLSILLGHGHKKIRDYQRDPEQTDQRRESDLRLRDSFHALEQTQQLDHIGGCRRRRNRGQVQGVDSQKVSDYAD